MTASHGGPSDDQLLGGMGAGRLDALGALYDRHAAAVFGAVLAATGVDAAGAEDRVRDAFLAAWRGALDRPGDAGGALAWLLELAGGAAAAGPAGAAGAAVTPPPALRGRVLAAAYADLAERRHPAAGPARRPARRMKQVDVGGTMIEIPDDDLDVLDGDRGDDRARGARRAVAIGAAILVFLVGAWAFMLQRELVEARDARSATEAAMVLAAAPGSSLKALTGPDGAAAGLLVLGGDGEVRLVLIGLAPLPSGEVYAVWLRRTASDAWTRVTELRPDRDGGGAAAARLEGAPPAVFALVTREQAEGASVPAADAVASGVAP